MSLINPEYILETSWEVCNKVGGIYTVLSTRAASLQKTHPDKVIFFGPDVWGDNNNPYFIESKQVPISDWQEAAVTEGLKVRIGRWDIPGKPLAVLVDFQDYFAQKNAIYAHFWEQFSVDSIAAYGDYDESSMFGYAVGVAMESFYRFYKLSKNNPTVAHFNEWMTTFGLFYIKEHLPEVGTLFTTHATSIGRSIAGNNKPLYDQLTAYNGDQMAHELNMVAKHSTEKRAAYLSDCFTTVSDITNEECRYLLDKPADVVTPNGFEAEFVPRGKAFVDKRADARAKLIDIASRVTATHISDDTLLVATSGRYEYKNKGIDVFITSLKRLAERNPSKEVLAFVLVPAHQAGPRKDLLENMRNPNQLLNSWNKHTTHELYDYDNDQAMSIIRWFHLNNELYDKVKVVFFPAYITEEDPIFQRSYYDLLIGFDLTVFPSYYEPWGYTPLESVAFQIPTITTSLSGFGQWSKAYSVDIMGGVGVVNRSDYNTEEVIDQITDMMDRYLVLNPRKKDQVRRKASEIAKKALWKHFMQYYYESYDVALRKVAQR